MNWFATNLLSAFLLPPLNLLVLGVLGLVLMNPRPRLGKCLIIITFALLHIASTPYFAEGALKTLEPPAMQTPEIDPKAEAIVVLGAGTYVNAPEYGGDTVSKLALERLRYAARLHKRTGKPILVSGGTPFGNKASEATLMKAALIDDLQVPVAWIEDKSESTFENALHSGDILQRAGIGKVYLVTHAWHMRRAVLAFERAGVAVVPAPTGFTTRHKLDVMAFIPRAESLLDSKIFVHETIGLAWYRLRSQLGKFG